MNGIIIGGSVAVGITLLGVGYTIGTYNSMVGMRTDVKNQWSNILTEYQRRVDLLINLARTVKSYKSFEKETLTAVVKARSGLKENLGRKQQEDSMKAIDKLGLSINALWEAYPNLKSNEQHNMLMEESRITEDRINSARTSYNDTVRDYNVLVNEFPARIVASMFGFTTEPFFDLVSKDAAKAPLIDL